MCKGPPRSIDGYGIKCTSRYGLQAELNRIKGLAKILVMWEMPVTEIWCDSEIGNQYVVTLSVRDVEVAESVAGAVGGLTEQFYGSHSGIIVIFGGDMLAMLEGYWLPFPEHERGKQ
jgi:hypothetical protein